MPIIPDPPKTFTPAPEGQHNAVCCDAVDLGILESEWNGERRQSRKARLVFQIERTTDTGVRFTVARRFTNSLGQKAALRKFLDSWRGTSMTDSEAQHFDLETLIGAPALLQVIHNERDGTLWANIDTIMALPSGSEALEIVEYVRVQDRDGTMSQSGGPNADGNSTPFKK